MTNGRLPYFFCYFVQLNCAHVTCMDDGSEAIFRNARCQAVAWLDCRILDAIFLWRYVTAVQARDWNRVQGRKKYQYQPQKRKYDKYHSTVVSDSRYYYHVVTDCVFSFCRGSTSVTRRKTEIAKLPATQRPSTVYVPWILQHDVVTSVHTHRIIYNMSSRSFISHEQRNTIPPHLKASKRKTQDL